MKLCKECNSVIIFIVENVWLCPQHGFIYHLYSESESPIIEWLRHQCGNKLEMRWTKGHDPMLKVYCPTCEMFPQVLSSVHIANDWPTMGIVMELIIFLTRAAIRAKREVTI